MSKTMTFEQVVKAAEKLISDLESVDFDSPETAKHYSDRYTKLKPHLDALWSNPADAELASTLKRRIVDAIYRQP